MLIKNTSMKHYNFEYRVKVSLLILLLIMLTSCQGTTTPSSKVVTAKISLENASQIASQGGRYYIEFSPSITDMPLNQYFDLTVLIKGATQQPLSHSVRLTFDAGMKAHNHGMNVKPIIKPLGKGKFKIEGVLLHMPGKWFIRFNLLRGAMSDYAESDVFVAL